LKSLDGRTNKERKNKHEKLSSSKENDSDDIARQRLSNKIHYNKHREEVLERINKYQKSKLELAQIELLHSLQ
jgi:hypothetical protein